MENLNTCNCYCPDCTNDGWCGGCQCDCSLVVVTAAPAEEKCACYCTMCLLDGYCGSCRCECVA